ncbi:MAG TPA: glycosyltransferase family 4 protein [Methylovirgula sp.]|nr:glycosyltransferase family 4 protein [Methylovirgula sp.]
MGPSADGLGGRGAHPLAGLTILQIIPELNSGGAEAGAIDIATALAEVGARALVASEGGRMVSELQAKGGIWLPFPARTKNPFAMALNQRRLARLIVSEGIALVHARSRAPAWVAYGATRQTKIPFVTTYHGAYSGRGALKLRYNSIMAKGDAVIANSAYTARRIAALYPFAAENIRIIERGIDFRVFNPQDADPARVKSLRQAWNVTTDERIVLLAARLTAWKGHKLLIEAARRLVAGGLTGTKFILAGDDQGRTSYIREIDAAIAQAGLAGTVLRTGHCSDMPAALLAAAVLVVPSTQPEAFGRVAVEAQAMGTPVVVSDLGALPEIVLAPPDTDLALRTGWRVPVADASALAAAISEALTLGATARDALALRARAHVLRRFSVERMKSETLATYSALAAPRHER